MKTPRSMCLTRLNFLIDLGFCMVFTEVGEGKSDGTLIEWGKNVNVFAAVFCMPISVEKSVVKIRSPEAAIQA